MTKKLIEQIDAAMEATKNIYPPITRSQCQTIILAARAYLAAPEQSEPTKRQYDIAMRQWDQWKSYALELQVKLVKYEGGSPMILNAAPQPTTPADDAQGVELTDESFIYAVVRSKQPHLDDTSRDWAYVFSQCRFWMEAAEVERNKA